MSLRNTHWKTVTSSIGPDAASRRDYATGKDPRAGCEAAADLYGVVPGAWRGGPQVCNLSAEVKHANGWCEAGDLARVPGDHGGRRPWTSTRKNASHPTVSVSPRDAVSHFCLRPKALQAEPSHSYAARQSGDHAVATRLCMWESPRLLILLFRMLPWCRTCNGFWLMCSSV